MGHPDIKNGTPFVFEPIFIADEEGCPVLVPLVRATYDIADGGLRLAEEQVPAVVEGELYGEPGKSSYRYEPEGSLPKPATDVVLVGSAVAPRHGTTEMLVGFRVGTMTQSARVVGDRTFFRSGLSVGMTKPLPFERIPLQWERAFGGWDRSSLDEAKHAPEPRNPVGAGFRGKDSRFEVGLRCPNIEAPEEPFKGWGHRPRPVGFGFTSPDWEPRRQWAGTYDRDWEEARAPLLPRDFDRRFLNAAAPGLVAKGHLRGDEQVVVSGTTASGGLAFRLPGIGSPLVRVQLAGRQRVEVVTNLDTVIVDTDREKLFLLWKGELRLREPTAARALWIVPGAGTPPGPSLDQEDEDPEDVEELEDDEEPGDQEKPWPQASA